MRWNARTDSNQKAIVKALRAAPDTWVFDMSRVGGGFPDLLVVFKRGGVWHVYLMEVKTEHGKLNSLQREFFREYPFKDGICMIRTPAEALAVIGLCYDVDCGRWGGDIDCRCRRAGL